MRVVALGVRAAAASAPGATVTTASATPPSSRAALGADPSPRTFEQVVGSPAFIGAASLVVLAFVGVFFRWIVKQNEFSMSQLEDWGHAYVIPLISGYMVWQSREQLMRTVPSFYWPGLIPLVLGLACYYYFIVGIPNHMFQGCAMILSLFGVLLLLLGPGPMRVLFVPVAFLVFGITIAERVMIEITFQLKLIAAYGSWIVLSLIGTVADFTVDLQGTTLSIDTGTQVSDLDVANACSGMRMVIAFVALAGTVAVFSCRHWWQRTALLLLAVPVALLMNVLRVTILGLASLANKKFVGGDMHMMIGTLTLVPGLALFMGVVWALKRAVKDAPAPAEPARPVRVSPPGWGLLARPAMLAALVILGASAAGMSEAIHRAKIFLKKEAIYAPGNRLLLEIPIRTLSWERQGTDAMASKEVEEELGTTNHVTRAYVRRSGESAGARLDLHAAYYTKQVDTVPHVPERCFVAGGLQMVKEWGDVPVPLDRSRWREDTDVPESMKGRVFKAPVLNEVGAVSSYVHLPLDPGALKIHVTEFAGRNARVMSGYFFIANGGTVAKANDVRLLAFNLTDTYSYYVKVQFSSTTARTGEELAAEAGGLLDELLPEIMRCVPDWVDVTRGDYPPDNPARSAGAGS